MLKNLLINALDWLIGALDRLSGLLVVVILKLKPVTMTFSLGDDPFSWSVEIKEVEGGPQLRPGDALFWEKLEQGLHPDDLHSVSQCVFTLLADEPNDRSTMLMSSPLDFPRPDLYGNFRRLCEDLQKIFEIDQVFLFTPKLRIEGVFCPISQQWVAFFSNFAQT